MRLADAVEHLVAGHLSARDRAIGGDRKSITAAGRENLALIEERVDLDLIGHQRLARKLDRVSQQRCGEIGHADMARAALALGLA